MPFRGIYPALLTPFDADGQLNETMLRELLDFQLWAGVHGFWINGGAGEGLLLTSEERRRVAEVVMDHVRDQVPVIVHVGALATREAVSLARHAETIGAAAVACLPPLYYRPDEMAIVDHYRLVGSATSLPLFVYNIPGATGVTLTPELIARLVAEIPTVRGIKHSSFDLYAFQQMRERTDDDFTLFSGSDEVLLAALSMGGNGAVGSNFNLLPGAFVELYEAFRQGDIRRAQMLQERVNAIIRVLLRFPVLPATKAAMRCIGLNCGDCRRPLRTLTAAEEEVLRAGLEEAGLLRGDGCRG